jgi:hypothetical protein
MVLMAQQVGCQSGSRPSIHNHSNVNQGGPIVLEERIVGAAVLIQNLAVKSRAGIPAFTLLKEITIQENSPGTCTVFYTLQRTAGAGAVNAQLYVNDVAVGVDNASNPGPDVWNDVLALDLVAGDRIQLYGHTNGANTLTVSDFEISYANALNAISTHELTALLATNYAIPILTYNSMV